MITRYCLCWRKNNTTYKAHLHSLAKATGLPYRMNNASLSCPLVEGLLSNCVNVKASDTICHVFDVTPRITITINATYNPQPYQDPYVINSLKMQVNTFNSDNPYHRTRDISIPCTINRKVALQQKVGDAFVQKLVLPADGAQASDSASYRVASLEFRLAYYNASEIRIVGYSSTFSGSTTIDIPSTYWGV